MRQGSHAADSRADLTDNDYSPEVFSREREAGQHAVEMNKALIARKPFSLLPESADLPISCRATLS
jgi:hypothetical protein